VPLVDNEFIETVTATTPAYLRRPAAVALVGKRAKVERDRMQEAVRRLGQRLREVKGEEEQARRRAADDATLVERAKLAKELADVHPPLAEQLADLAGRLAASDAAIERVNQKLPDGKKRLANAELVARQLSNFVDGPSNIPRITWHMRLPAFRYVRLDPYTWPRQS